VVLARVSIRYGRCRRTRRPNHLRRDPLAIVGRRVYRGLRIRRPPRVGNVSVDPANRTRSSSAISRGERPFLSIRYRKTHCHGQVRPRSPKLG
jgi:hypothetical protein